MKYYFIVKATKPKDPFYILVSEDQISLYCEGLDDLRKTIRTLTAKGYRVRSSKWFSKCLRSGQGELDLKNPFFKTNMFSIRRIPIRQRSYKRMIYTNSFGFTHVLKLVDQDELTIQQTIRFK